MGCVCCACWWQCGVVSNCSAWFVLVNVGFVERSAFCWEYSVPVKVWVHCSVGCCVL